VKYVLLKPNLIFVILLVISCLFSKQSFSENAKSWKEIDRYYKKNNIDIYNLQASEIKKLKSYETIPDNFATLEDVQKKKEIFYLIAYPLIHKNNEDIKQERKIIIDMEKKGSIKDLNSEDLDSLKILTKKYKLEFNLEDKYLYKKLKQRINVIPVSLALGQAIIESGWGQSRFAIEGNALYGQWTFDQQEGLIPEKRDPDKTHAVKKFDKLEDSVRSYMYNINTHMAYYEFRVIRRITDRIGAMDENVRIKIKLLAAYAEIGKKYVDKLELVFDSNNLSEFDGIN